MRRKRLLTYRNFSGIGDWIMGLTVLKMINQQYPEIDIYLNLMAKNAHKHPKKFKVISPFIQEIVSSFDVRIAGTTFYEDVKTHTSEFDFVSNLKYRKREKIFFIKGMVNRFNQLTGLRLRYDPAVYAQNQKKPATKEKRPYILIQACSKRHNKTQLWKDYGSENMDKVATEISGHIEVIQIGAIGDIPLKNVSKRVLGTSLPKLHKLMKECLCFVGLDGMLGIYAAHHAVKQFIIYSGKFNMIWTKFPNRLQLNGNIYNYQSIAQLIIEDLCAVNSEKQFAA